MKPNSYILRETASRIVIATGFTRPSNNPKTGPMIQIYILARHSHPLDAARSGADELVCGDCPLRPASGGGCYVNLWQSPHHIWKAYRYGNYGRLPSLELFRNRSVRFGAYGDPVFIPLQTVRAICRRASRWTGFTHQWRRPCYDSYRKHFMASVESPSDQRLARSCGWRTFRVRHPSQPLLQREITCPASSEAGHRTTCHDCGLCNGSETRTRRESHSDRRKNIAILAHGNQAGRVFQRRLQA